MAEMYLDYVGNFEDCFGFAVGPDSPNEIISQQVLHNLNHQKGFRLVVTAIQEVPEGLYNL